MKDNVISLYSKYMTVNIVIHTDQMPVLKYISNIQNVHTYRIAVVVNTDNTAPVNISVDILNNVLYC